MLKGRAARGKEVGGILLIPWNTISSVLRKHFLSNMFTYKNFILFFCVFSYCSCKQETKEQYCWVTTISSKGKGLFSPTDGNDQTSQSGPPSKQVLNIPVGPNRKSLFHLMYQPKFLEFWIEWKKPFLFSIQEFPSKLLKNGREPAHRP